MRTATKIIDGVEYSLSSLSKQKTDELERKYHYKWNNQQKMQYYETLRTETQPALIEFAKEQIEKFDSLMCDCVEESNIEYLLAVYKNNDFVTREYLLEDSERFDKLLIESNSFLLDIESIENRAIEIFINRLNEDRDKTITQGQIANMLEEIQRAVMSGDDKKKQYFTA